MIVGGSKLLHSVRNPAKSALDTYRQRKTSMSWATRAAAYVSASTNRPVYVVQEGPTKRLVTEQYVGFIDSPKPFRALRVTPNGEVHEVRLVPSKNKEH